MGEISLIQTGLEVITDNLEQQRESSSLANERFESGFSKLENAKRLLAQATAEIEGARVDFQQAVEASLVSQEAQVTAHNACQASGINDLDQGPARELSFFLDHLGGETEKLTSLYSVNTRFARTTLALLGQAHQMVNTHLESWSDLKSYTRASHCNDKARLAATQIDYRKIL